MTSDPEIAIVTAAFNAERFVADTIQSVQAQSLTDWEHIIVDDGSTDRTVEAATEVGDHRLRIIRHSNVGQSAAQNIGLADVRSRFVVMLDADDRLLPDALHRLRSAIEAERDLVLAYGHVWLIDQNGVSFGSRHRFQASPSGDRLAGLLQKNLITTGGAAMIRTQAIRDVGGFDQNLNMAQGWECWVRLAALGPIAEVGGDAVLEYRLHAGSVARRSLFDPSRSKPAVDLMFENPKVRAKFSKRSLANLRKRCDAHICYMAGHEALRVGDRQVAKKRLVESLQKNPRKMNSWILLACAIVGWLPGPVARRLGGAVEPRRTSRID